MHGLSHSKIYHIRSRNEFEGAIRAHGGEAQNAKEAFVNLSEVQQQAMSAFLESL